MWIGIIIGWIVLSILAGIGARNKGRSFAGFFFLSLLLSPLIGLIAMAVAKPVKKDQEQQKPTEAPRQPTIDRVPAPMGVEINCPNCGSRKISGEACPTCSSLAR
jgi:hypothetical protein